MPVRGHFAYAIKAYSPFDAAGAKPPLASGKLSVWCLPHGLRFAHCVLSAIGQLHKGALVV